MINSVSTVALILAILTLLTANRTEAGPINPSKPSLKTIRVQETIRVYHRKAGKFSPFLSSDIWIKGPNKVSAVVRLLPSQEKVYLYLADGKNEYDYLGQAHGYYERPFFPHRPSQSMVRQIVQIDLILTGVPTLADLGAKRTVTKAVLDGREMTLTTDQSSSGRTRYWVDSRTHLPYREMTEEMNSGKLIPATQRDFSGWKMNRPIPQAQFAWNTPPGAHFLSSPNTNPQPSHEHAQSPPQKTLAVGAVAPEFAALSSDGSTVHLSDLRGEIVVLDLWATWCGPCQESMPHLEKVYQQVKDKNVAVLAVCVSDQKKGFDQWVTQNSGVKYHFPVAFDTKSGGKGDIAGDLYHVQGIPTQFIIDKAGKIAAVNVGYGEGDTRLESGLGKLGVDIPIPPGITK